MLVAPPLVMQHAALYHFGGQRPRGQGAGERRRWPWLAGAAVLMALVAALVWRTAPPAPPAASPVGAATAGARRDTLAFTLGELVVQSLPMGMRHGP